MSVQAAQVALQALPMLQKLASSSKQKSSEIFGYDFIGLVFKLVLYYTVAYIIAKYMEFAIYGSGFIKTLVSIFGLNLPPLFPKQFEALFTDGYGQYHIKYWDIVKSISIVIIAYEGYNYYRTNKAAGAHVDIMTIALFGLIEGFLVMITIPEILQRIKAKGIIFEFSKDSAAQGEQIGLSIAGLISNTPYLYGWREIQFEMQRMSDAQGNDTFPVDIASTTPPGIYTVYIDQSSWGGGYAQKQFRVLPASAAANQFSDLGGSI